ncbi:rCG33822 [Rattus norvegicus]|uniref:RCG33822 n=1 Tax=Rattus norvegicus TaxID=10116 RepID=A6HL06_RAT|nr:rCG33822 [Rattus norvegicus]
MKYTIPSDWTKARSNSFLPRRVSSDFSLGDPGHLTGRLVRVHWM